MVTLRDLYVADLEELLDAEQQAAVDLPTLGRAATAAPLRALLDEHASRTRVHVERLELLLTKLGARRRTGRCDAVRAIIAEGRRRVDDGERGDVLDAALIGIAQRMEHYEIAMYGSVRAYARTLGDSEAAALLQQTLDEEAALNDRLTHVAEGGVNEAAGEDLASDAERQRSRLCYVPASQLADFKYREYRVRNDANEDLGSLDGLILDSRSHRPEYVVIDSGGWFVGQRYVVPVDAVVPEEEAHTLRTSLDRKTIQSYPPFNPDSYLAARSPSSPGEAEFRPPTWLMTGVWMTEASGFATVPPRAQADFEAPADEAAKAERASDLMTARGEREDRGTEARDGREPTRDRWRPPSEC